MADYFLSEFLRALSAIRDYLSDVIVIGGCVPFIYTKYLYETGPVPVFTRDLDLLVGNRIPVRNRSIVSLMEEAGYGGRTLKSNHIQYFKFESRDKTGFEVEFLTTKPAGKEIDNLVVQGGLRAQILPGLEILNRNNIEVRITDAIDNLSFDGVVRVPTPAAFVLNKLSSYIAPIGLERQKDIYYVYHVVRNLPIGAKELVADIRAIAGSRQVKMIRGKLAPLFSSQYSQGTRELAAQLTDVEMTEENKRLLALGEISELIELMEE